MTPEQEARIIAKIIAHIEAAEKVTRGVTRETGDKVIAHSEAAHQVTRQSAREAVAGVSGSGGLTEAQVETVVKRVLEKQHLVVG